MVSLFIECNFYVSKQCAKNVSQNVTQQMRYVFVIGLEEHLVVVSECEF